MFRFALMTMVGWLALAPAAQAGDASPWSRDQAAAMRLVAGAAVPGTQMRRAGVEIALQPGWKTYWRYPGDAGVPPRFDWSQSDNLATAEVLWPVPVSFADGPVVSIGYHDGVVFPVHVTPRDPARPVTLVLALDYAVCKTLCLPAVGQARLTLPVGAGGHDALVRAHEARVPARKPGTVISVAVAADVTPPVATLVLAVPEGAREVAAFVEGPSDSWALPVPEPVSATGGRATVRVPLDGLPAGTPWQGAVLRVTVSAGDAAFEDKATLPR
jgi:DsbC/DsbD-like thiol-disulfide interchange protein